MKILQICTLAGIALWAMLLTSCQHEPELIAGTPTVCFDNEVLPIFQTGCSMSGCHTGNGELFPLLTYDDIASRVTAGKPMASKLHKVISANINSGNFMPPKPKSPLTSAQIDIISLWILQGAKHTTCNGTECDSVNVTFTGTILPITDLYCRGCHSGGNPSGGILLTDYTSIKASVDGGRFVGAVEQLDGYSAMPKDSGKLSVCNLAQLRKWINDGMPNN